jgi:hypothetical protein
MKPYYGLRLIRSFFLSLAIILCIVSVAAVGALFGFALFNSIPFNAWQAFSILIIGGLIALLSSAFAQLIDLQLENYAAIEALEAEMKEIKAQNAEVLKLLEKQIQGMRLRTGVQQEPDLDVIQQQLEERRKKLS